MIRLAFLLLLIASSALADPAPTGLTGTLTNGQTVTIIGTGFGTKSTVAPLLWSNFENGTAGQLVSSDANWDTQIECTAAYNGGTPSMIYSTERAYGGTKSIKQVLVDVAPCWTRTTLGVIGNISAVYASYHYFENTGGTGDHTKMGRIGCNDDVHCWPDVGYTAYNPSAEHGGYLYAFAQEMDEHSLEDVSNIAGSWVRTEMYAVISGDNQNNGTVGFWRNGSQAYYSTAVNTYDSASGHAYYNQFFMPYYNEGGSRTFYIDDVYIDNTLARIEICSGSTWAARGTCSIQIPHTTWNDTTIQATVNQGADADLTDNYLYIVNASGVANASGYDLSDVEPTRLTPARHIGGAGTVKHAGGMGIAP